MNSTWLVATALIALFHGQPIQKPMSEKYAPEGGRFTINFPGKPKESTQTAKSEIGDVKVFTATYATSDGNVLMVSYSDLPAAATKPENLKTLFEGVRAGAKGQYELILDDEAVDFDSGNGKLPAHYLMLKNEKTKQQLRLRVIVSGDRLYQVAAIGPQKFVEGKEATAFLDSFKVTK